jgi:hypothetical protein
LKANQGAAAQNAQIPKAAETPLSAKIGYIGTGIIVGMIIYPFVRKTLAKAQPNLDKLFDGLTGKAEGFAEMASDLIAKAKQSLSDHDKKPDHGPAPKDPGHDHEHEHDHTHEH